MEGEIDMDMDNSTVRRPAGDVQVQLGTIHFGCRSDQVVRAVFGLSTPNRSAAASGSSATSAEQW